MSVNRHAAPDSQRVGVLISESIDGGSPVHQDLVCCAHCGYTWTFSPGSMRLRGYCQTCGGLVCGCYWCRDRECVKGYMFSIENLEAGRAWDHRTETVSVPRSVTRGGVILG